MEGKLRDTGLGRVIGGVANKTKLQPEPELPWPLSSVSSRNYDLSHKLESARIVADFIGVQRVMSWDSDSASIQSDDDSLAELKRSSSEDEYGWDGPDDPENPLNFSKSRKVFITALICFLTICVYLGSSIYSPGINSIEQDFHISTTVATLGTSISLVGYAIGPMIFSPLSECPSIGRNPVYLLTLLLFVLIQVPIATAPNVGTILIFRFFSGLLGSPAQATGGATISDIYDPQPRSYAIGLWELSTWIAPTLGPLVGGLAAQRWGWRWTIWELLAINSVMLLLIFIFLPETSASNILYRRAKRQRRSGVNKASRSDPELSLSTAQSKKQLVYHAVVRPFKLCFREPICLLLNTYTALITGLFFAWLESFPVVFGSIYHFDLPQLGLAFLGLLVGALVATAVFVIWFRTCEAKKFDRKERRKPEERFIPLMAGCFFVPLSLFSFGWSARHSVHYIIPIIGSGLFSLGSFSLFISILNYLPDAYPAYAASVLAGNNFIRCTFGAGCVLFAGPMYRDLGPAWASTMLGIIGAAFVPVPFLFWRFGGRIRGASRFALKVC